VYRFAFASRVSMVSWDRNFPSGDQSWVSPARALFGAQSPKGLERWHGPGPIGAERTPVRTTSEGVPVRKAGDVVRHSAGCRRHLTCVAPPPSGCLGGDGHAEVVHGQNGRVNASTNDPLVVSAPELDLFVLHDSLASRRHSTALAPPVLSFVLRPSHM
jgi:hypothetical protein